MEYIKKVAVCIYRCTLKENVCVVVLFQDSIDNVNKFFLVEQKTYKRIWKFKITYVQLRPKKKDNVCTPSNVI